MYIVYKKEKSISATKMLGGSWKNRKNTHTHVLIKKFSKILLRGKTGWSKNCQGCVDRSSQNCVEKNRVQLSVTMLVVGCVSLAHTLVVKIFLT